jgi:hypothetical protein
VLFADSVLQRNSASVTIALFIVATSITLYLRQKDKASKTLDYRVIDDVPIFSGHDRPEKLRVIYGTADINTEVNDPRVTRVRFKNTGNQVIEAADFQEPFGITRPCSKILDVNVFEQSEHDLATVSELALSDNESSVKFDVKTLNSGDWFTVQLVYDGGEGESITVSGRIKGQTRRPEIFSAVNEFGSVTAARWSIIAGAALLVLGVAAAIQTATLFGVTGLIMAGTGGYLVVLGTSQTSSRLLYTTLVVTLFVAVLSLATSVVRERMFGTEKYPGRVATHLYWLGAQWWHPLLVVGAITLSATLIVAAKPGRSIRQHRR